MARDNKKAKADTAPKPDTAAKSDATAKVKSPVAEDTATATAKPKAEEPAGAAPANYSRGEGQKPVTAAYRENWNAIFANKTKKKKKSKRQLG